MNLKGIKRDIEIKGQIPEKYNENIEQFKDDILSTITSTKSFFALDDKKNVINERRKSIINRILFYGKIY